jgi:hypothetical protein
MRIPRWAAAVFGMALLARLAFLVLADQPLLYTHQYHYFTNALAIAEHPQPLRHVLASDEWRTWNQHWTIAPLYHLFAAAVLGLSGPHLLPLRLLQCVLDSLAAVGVGFLGRQAAGPRGAWAGVAYALYFPAVEMATWTMTENLHTPLFVAAVALLAREGMRPGPGQALLGGVLVGLAALARSVSTGFLALATLWRLWRRQDGRRSWRAAALLAAGGAAVILPWTARNVLVIGEPVLIETAAFENIWWANHFVDRARFHNQERVVHGQPTPADKRAAALHFALRGIRRHPERFVEKAWSNFWHFLRPEGLQNLVGIERTLEPWRHAASLLLDDAILLAALPLFVAFLCGGRPSPARALIALWVAYYLFMVVVVFHNEIRYRSAFVPFALAGAAGGVAALRDPARRWRALAGLAAGLALVAGALAPFRVPAWQGLRARVPFGQVRAAVTQGDHERAEGLAAALAERAPRSARPWFDYGRLLMQHGEAEAALAAYEKGQARATVANWRGLLARPHLNEALGRAEDAERTGRTLDRLSFDTDPWLLIETAWREVPPPRADTLRLGSGADYGAVRGFLHPRGGDPLLSAHRLEWNRYDAAGSPQPPPGTHRWSRRRAWLRLMPASPAPAYDVTITMGVPFPSPLGSAEVRAGAVGEPWHSFRVGAELSACSFRAPAPPPGQPLVIRLRAPTWNRVGEPAEQGVRVDLVQVTPAR